MANEKGTKEEAQSGTISITADQLASIVAIAVERATASVVDAMRDLKKPYEDPLKKENEDMMREQFRESERRKRESLRLSQEFCQHYQGCDGDRRGELSSWLRHRFDDGVVRGICTNCNRTLTPADPDYLKEIRRASGNRMSSSGDRQLLLTRQSF